MLHKEFLQLLGCPECTGELDYQINFIVCKNCGSRYSIINGIPDFRSIDVGSDLENLIHFWENLEFDYDIYMQELSKEYLYAIDTPLISNVRGMVLEIGCGTARLKEKVEAANCNYIGLDISAEMIKKAYDDGKSNLVLGMGESLPFHDNSFDSIIGGYHSFRSIKLDSCLKECSRVLKPNGVLAFTLVNYWSLYINVLLRNIRNFRTEWVKLPSIKTKEICNEVFWYKNEKSLLNKSGFKIVSLMSTKNFIFSKKGFHGYWNHPLGTLFGNDIIFICKNVK
ncbi:methyltransferase domain-containing protein [Methanobacterium oryzae]|uniref:methyltransferase domain-containing protein n=1 Tax=Methanobacterium oryzae TaxID=69540 RepID=UPI003D24076D